MANELICIYSFFKIKTIMKKSTKKSLTIDGFMNIGQTENGACRMDFLCTEDVEIEAFDGVFKLQAMHDGSIYMTEKPKRVRNKPLFRQDNSSLSLSRNGRYYFVFQMPETFEEDLAEKLVSEARECARKIKRSRNAN